METNTKTLTEEITDAYAGDCPDVDGLIARLCCSPLDGPAIEAIANAAISGGINHRSPNGRDFALGYIGVDADCQSPAMYARGQDFAAHVASVLS